MTSTGGLASWRFGDGKTHTMVVEEAITQLMTERPRAGAGQIHDAKNDVFLLVAVGNNPGGKSTTADVIAQFDNSQTKRPIIENSGYTLGDFFTLTVAVTPTGTVLVSIDYKGTTYSVSESSFPNIQSDNESLNGMYFKAGLYPQSNVNDYHEQPMDMAELVMKRVSVSHQ
jgi:hypothetical protein